MLLTLWRCAYEETGVTRAYIGPSYIISAIVYLGSLVPGIYRQNKKSRMICMPRTKECVNGGGNFSAPEKHPEYRESLTAGPSRQNPHFRTPVTAWAATAIYDQTGRRARTAE